MAQLYGSIPAGAKVDIPSSIPSGMLYRIKQILGCNREQVRIVPISGQTLVRGGQKIIVPLPPNSLVDLSTFEMVFDGYTDHGGNTAGTNNDKLVQCRYFPRNIQGIIESIDIKINGSSKQRIDQYGYIYNILHDFNAGDDSIRKNRIGQNADPSLKFWNFKGKTKRRNLYPVGIVGIPETANDKANYTIRQWLGLLGGNASTSIIHTGMLGEVVIEITLAGGGVLSQSVKPNTAAYTNANSLTDGYMINLNTLDDATATAYATTGAIVAQGTNYTLENINFNITKYSMPSSFYDAMANILSSGGNYQIYYPNYSVFQGNSTDNKNCTTRFSIATKSLDMVIGTFQVPNRDTISNPLLASSTTYKVSLDTSAIGEEGDQQVSYDDLIKVGFPVLLNNSRYFCRNGDFLQQCRYLIGGTPLNYENMTEMYNGVLRAFNNSQNDMLGGIHKGCASLDHFRSQYFAHILKLNAQTDTDVYNLSGVNCNENSIDITWECQGSTTDITKQNTLVLTTNVCVPILIACYSSHIDISANRNIVYYT